MCHGMEWNDTKEKRKIDKIYQIVIDVNIKYLYVVFHAVNMHNPIFCFT